MVTHWMPRLAIAMAVGCTGVANAVEVAYDFTVAWNKAGPAFGSFALDGQVAPSGGGRVRNFAPTHFDLSIDGTPITEATAIVGIADFDANGALTYVVIGNRCSSVGCSVGFDGSLSWVMAFSPVTDHGFPTGTNGQALACDCSLLTPSGADIRYQDEGWVFLGHIDSPPVVPEPREWLLLVAGLATMLVFPSRRAALRRKEALYPIARGLSRL